MTRRRECVWVKFDLKETASFDRAGFNIEYKPDGKDQKYTYFLYLGQKALSRDIVSPNAFDNNKFLRRAIESGGELLPLDKAKSLNIIKNGTLNITVDALDEFCANGMFLGHFLRLGVNPYVYYIGQLFMDMKFCVRPASDRVPAKEDNAGHKYRDGDFDFADLKVYGALRDILFKNHYYEDDLNIEYSVSYGQNKAYYFINIWHSNHLWRNDPAVLSIYRVTARLSADGVSRERIRFESPIKYTEDLRGEKGYFIEEITSKFIAPKGINIFSGLDEENPNEGVMKFDTLFKFARWRAFRDAEIYEA